MKRLRATIDIYIELDEETTEEDAVNVANNFIDTINGGSCKEISTNVQVSEIYKQEVEEI